MNYVLWQLNLYTGTSLVQMFCLNKETANISFLDHNDNKKISMFFPEYPFTTVCLHTTHTLVHWANKYLCYLDKLITLSLSKFTICYKCKRAQIPNFTFAIISTHCYTVRAFKFFFWQKKILLAPQAWQVDSCDNNATC